MNKPITVRMAGFSARHRWLVLGVWCISMIGMTMLGAGLPPSSQTNNQATGFEIEASKASRIFNENQPQTEPYEDFFMVVNHPTLKVTDPDFKATVEGLSQDLARLTYEGKPLFVALLNPYQAPPEIKTIASDATTVRIYGRVAGETFGSALSTKFNAVKDTLKTLEQQRPSYKILIYSQTLSFNEANQNSQESVQKSLAFTLIPTFLILLVVFGAVAAAVVPLLLAITAIIGTTGVILIYSRLSGNTDIASATLISVLMGLAVAVDYSLFVISRYRQERNRGHDKLKALDIASGTAGRAVFFSGILVAIAVSGLLFLGGQLTSISMAIITVVLLSVVGSVTFLPALLSILGNGINWGRLPFLGRSTAGENNWWARLVRWVMRYPIPVTVIVTVLLTALATPLFHIKLGTSLFSGDKLEGTQATRLMLEKWPEGTELKVEVVITGADRPETQAAIQKFQAAALQVPTVNGPVVATTTTNGKAVRLSFTQPGNANDAANQAAVSRLRNEIVPDYFQNLPGTEVHIGGYAAFAGDSNRFFTNPVVWIFVLTLSFVVLMLVFRSVVIALKAVLLNLLSTGAAYGVVILVFQDGLIWVKPIGYLENYLPVIMFTIIFGLSMDYHLFILTRIKELRDKGQPTDEAVARGIASTSGTITGAAAIMVIVFGDFFLGIDSVTIQQLGLGLAVAVLVDATLVRSMLLPAVMRLMGEYNWWMPRFLNWLPLITIEAEDEDVAAAREHTTPALARPEPARTGDGAR